MTIRTAFFLVASLSLAAACKKDNPKQRYHGILLHGINKTPIANAQVTLAVGAVFGLPVFMPDANLPSSTTNDKGEYEFVLDGKDFEPYYSLSAIKPGLEYGRRTTQRNDVIPDTIYLYDPGYLRIIAKTDKAPVQPSMYRLSWYLYDSKDTAVKSGRFIADGNVYYDRPLAGDTIQMSYPRGRYDKASIGLYAASGIGDQSYTQPLKTELAAIGIADSFEIRLVY